MCTSAKQLLQSSVSVCFVSRCVEYGHALMGPPPSIVNGVEGFRARVGSGLELGSGSGSGSGSGPGCAHSLGASGLRAVTTGAVVRAMAATDIQEGMGTSCAADDAASEPMLFSVQLPCLYGGGHQHGTRRHTWGHSSGTITSRRRPRIGISRVTISHRITPKL